MSKELCIVVAIILFIAALLVGKNASKTFWYYVAKSMGIAAVIFMICAFIVPSSGGVVDMEYCVLSAIIWACICLAIFFKLLPYIIGIAIVGGGIWLLAWVFRNALADGGTAIVMAIICFVGLFIIGLIRKAVK